MTDVVPILDAEGLRDDEPFFARARYVGRREDFDHFTTSRPDRPYVRDQLLALQATGRLELVDSDVSSLPGLTLEHVPGHTPGQCIERAGDGFAWRPLD